MTWNLWWRFGPWEARQAAIATVLEEQDADIVCLQEVWAEDNGADQAAVLADSLGFHFARTPSPYWNGVSFGNAVLSRGPILGVESRHLPGADGQPGHRTALLAEVETSVGPVSVVSTHTEFRFDHSATRVGQLAAIARFVADRRSNPDTAFPVIVAGDFNGVPDSDEIRQFTGRSAPAVPGLVFQDAWELSGQAGSPGYTWNGANPYLADSVWPNRRIDYVMVSWPRPKTLGTPVRCWIAGDRPIGGIQPSDHYAVLAELRTS